MDLQSFPIHESTAFQIQYLQELSEREWDFQWMSMELTSTAISSLPTQKLLWNYELNGIIKWIRMVKFGEIGFQIRF
jgi:hypothetical protein